MQSKNKPSMRVDERAYVAEIKEQPCVVCDTSGPSDAHEIEQGLWYTSIPLCRSCHMDHFNGIHGQARIWRVRKMNELKALNETIRRMRHGR
jgi:hypothetical protein